MHRKSNLPDFIIHILDAEISCYRIHGVGCFSRIVCADWHSIGKVGSAKASIFASVLYGGDGCIVRVVANR